MQLKYIFMETRAARIAVHQKTGKEKKRKCILMNISESRCSVK